MAGGAGTNAAAVVVKMYIVFLGQFEDGHIFKVALDSFWGNIRVFKQKVDNSHNRVARSHFALCNAKFISQCVARETHFAVFQ